MTVSFLAGDNMALININYESKTLGMPVMINAIIPQGRGSLRLYIFFMEWEEIIQHGLRNPERQIM